MQDPAPPTNLELPEAPSTSLGPHLFYAIQWWLFIGIALIGYVLLLRRQALDEASADAYGSQGPPSGADTKSEPSDVTPLTGASD